MAANTADNHHITLPSSQVMEVTNRHLLKVMDTNNRLHSLTAATNSLLLHSNTVDTTLLHKHNTLPADLECPR